VKKKWNFQRVGGGGGVYIMWADFGNSRGERGLYGKFLPWGAGVEGGMDIFWNYTVSIIQ